MSFRGASRPLIVVADGPDGPATSPKAVAEQLGVDSYDVFTGWQTRPLDWLSEDGETGYTVMANGAMTKPVNAGRFQYLPVRQSGVPRMLRDVAQPDFVLVAGVRRGNELAFKGSIGWADVAASLASKVIVEVDEHAPDLGAQLIPGPIVAEVPTPTDVPAGQVAPRQSDEIDTAIGELVASLIPKDATIQIGPGAIAEAALRALTQPVAIHSGICTDATADLLPRGLLRGSVTTPYLFGTEPINELAAAGHLNLQSVTVTHDLTAVSAIPRFVAVNAALQVGLDGAVNIERIGSRVFSGLGGHADYCLAASRSADGLSVIALRAQTRKGLPTIVEHVDHVSTPGTDVDVVVTEHGIADLRGCDATERAKRLEAIAS